MLGRLWRLGQVQFWANKWEEPIHGVEEQIRKCSNGDERKQHQYEKATPV
jgi:hypothetical protein